MGPTCTGKSTILKQVVIIIVFIFVVVVDMLSLTSDLCYEAQAAALRPETEMRVINPKALQASQSLSGVMLIMKTKGSQLFGQPASSDTGWKDGLISRCFRFPLFIQIIANILNKCIKGVFLLPK